MPRSSTMWLVVQAGTRRTILRRFISSLAERGTELKILLEDHYFQWGNGVPTLWMRISAEGGDRGWNTLLVASEDLLDSLMALHRWEERPLLEWPGSEGQGRLLVQMLPPDAGVLDSAIDPFVSTAIDQLRRMLYELLQGDGAVIKNGWRWTVTRSVEKYPELQLPRAELLKSLPAEIACRVVEYWADVSARPEPNEEGERLWLTMSKLLGTLDPRQRNLLFDAVANRLAFRPDETAYIMLLARIEPPLA